MFLNSSVWWMDLPIPVYLFGESYDFSAKIIVLFLLHGEYGPASSWH
ncbi:MAG: hypothetical protein IIT36_02550 [Aeriscardovia sp.]|nr:hypothetical protein [Aeriscardovia sp.]